MVHMGCLPLGSAGVPGSRLHPGRHVQEWSPKAAVRGAQEKGVLLWDEGARPVQLGWRDMLWEDRQVRMGAAQAAGSAPPRPPCRGTAASRCTEYLLPRGTRTDGQRAGRRGGGVLCVMAPVCTRTLPRKVWKHTTNQKLLGDLGRPPHPPPGVQPSLSLQAVVLGGFPSSAQAAVWGLPSPGTALGPGCTPSRMHVASAMTPLSTWRGRSPPRNAVLLSLPRLRPWGPCGSGPTRPRAQTAKFCGGRPISGDPAPRPGSPQPPCLPRAKPPRPQRVGSWCPTTAGTPGRGLSASRLPPARWAGRLPPAPGAPSVAHLHASTPAGTFLPTRPSGLCKDCRVPTSQTALGLWAPWAAGGAGPGGVGPPREGQEQHPPAPPARRPSG